MDTMKKIVSIVAVIAVAMSVMGVPARQGGMVRTAADGTQKLVFLHGNEHFHYMTDEEGNWLDEQTLAPLSEEARAAMEEAGVARQIRRAKEQKLGVGDEPNPAPRGLLILVNFQDSKFVTPNDTIDAMLNGDHFTRSYKYDYEYVSPTTGQHTMIHYDGSSEGSVRQYFHDQSYGQYNPQFDVVGPVTVSYNTAYYGANTSSDDGTDKNPVAMISEACKLADQNGVDFSQYDNDNDGFVDFVYVIYAGFGEADGGPAETIWPHQWDLSAYRYQYDNKYIGRYACGSELSFWSKLYAGIGTFCHEFSHVLGLPDIYETNSQLTGIHTSGDWDLMDYGPYNNDGNTPPSYTAYERFYMGWLTPRLLKDPEYVTLHPINEGDGESLLISTANTHNMSGWNPNPTEFYLLEAHNQDGWDTYLAGEGMLITRIRYNSSTWHSNAVNTNYRALGIDILEAKENTAKTKRGAATDAYPAGATEWTDYEDHEVTNIIRDAQTGVIQFSYRGADVPTGIENVQWDNEQRTKVTKVIRDGQLYLLYKGTMYNVQGKKIYEDYQL